MLTKHPDQYSGEELEAWVRHLVDDEVSEGPRLDYKETISLKGQKDRLEVAKDISSFANEIGGTLIYGIPENRVSEETAIPRKPYGMDSIPGLESTLENIYVASITPRLPEWRIRKVELTEYQGKVVYIIWTPESWIAPHMVAYEDKRYYRRGQLRAVVMNEHEIRARYERTRDLRGTVEQFLTSPELNYITDYFPADKFISHCVVCPLMLSAERVDFTTSEMREWLENNVYYLRGGWGLVGHMWTPSAYGVRNVPSAEVQKLQGDYLEIYRNGAVNYWKQAHVKQDDQNRYKLLLIPELHDIEELLRFAQGFYEKIQYFGPLRFQVKIENRPRVPLWRIRSRERFEHTDFQLITPDGNLSIDLTAPSSKLLENPDLILKEIGDKMYQAFGLWEADCFDEQGKLKR